MPDIEQQPVIAKTGPSTSRSAELRGEELTRAISGNSVAVPEPVGADVKGDRERRIREAAYRRAEQRGFAPGGDVDDWLAAEREVNEARGDGAIG
jgi:hypothetical protein